MIDIIENHKTLIVFDLDKTLASLTKPIDNRTLRFLKDLELKSNVQLAVNSMRSCEFLSGMWRQANLDPGKWFLVGENGAQIWYQAQMPCHKYFDPILHNIQVQITRLEIADKIYQILKDLVYYYDKPYGLVAFEPKETGLCGKKLLKIVKSTALDIPEPFEIWPESIGLVLGIKQISKFKAMLHLKEKNNFEKVVAFGDDLVYDLPMLGKADLGFLFQADPIDLPKGICQIKNMDDFLTEFYQYL